MEIPKVVVRILTDKEGNATQCFLCAKQHGRCFSRNMYVVWFCIKEVKISTVCRWGRCPGRRRWWRREGERQSQGKWAQDGFEGCLGIPTGWVICAFRN